MEFSWLQNGHEKEVASFAFILVVAFRLDFRFPIISEFVEKSVKNKLSSTRILFNSDIPLTIFQSDADILFNHVLFRIDSKAIIS